MLESAFVIVDKGYADDHSIINLYWNDKFV